MADWRETLFCWHGTVALHPDDKIVTWRGTWVGSTDGEMPSEADYAASENRFELTAAAAEGSDTLPAALQGGPINWSGWYLLDNGDGPERYEDWEHSALLDGAA